MIKRVRYLLGAALVLSVAVEALFIPHHAPTLPWHLLPGLWAVIGLGGSLLVVTVIKAVGKRGLQEPEDNHGH